MSLVGSIKEALMAVWEYIKKIFIKIIKFFENIVNWFKQPERLKKLQEDENCIAVAIKENLKNGNYNVINCLYDPNTNKLVDYEKDALIITGESLDSDTLSKFGQKEMIVIN